VSHTPVAAINARLLRTETITSQLPKTLLFNMTRDENDMRILETQLAAESRLGSADSMVDTLYRLEFDMARH
jgi:hypothetical protein